MSYSFSKQASSLASEKSFLYSPLEASSSFSNGKFLGGIAMIQLIRYSQSPVGPYDELLIAPGQFEHYVERLGKDGKATLDRRKNYRITRIYVSNEESCLSGRKSVSTLDLLWSSC